MLEDEGRRHRFVERLNGFEGIAIPSDKVGAQPTILLEALGNDDARRAFTHAFADLVAQLRQASGELAQPS